MSAILVYVGRKAFIRIKICRYSVIKANIVCYRGKIIVENITNLTGIIDNNFPFLKNYLIGVENRELSEIRGLLFYQKIFGTTVTSFSKICWFRLFTNSNRQISLPSLDVPFYLSLFISALHHIFLMNSTLEAAVHLRLICFLESFSSCGRFPHWYQK